MPTISNNLADVVAAMIAEANTDPEPSVLRIAAMVGNKPQNPKAVDDLLASKAAEKASAALKTALRNGLVFADRVGEVYKSARVYGEDKARVVTTCVAANRIFKSLAEGHALPSAVQALAVAYPAMPESYFAGRKLDAALKALLSLQDSFASDTAVMTLIKAASKVQKARAGSGKAASAPATKAPTPAAQMEPAH